MLNDRHSGLFLEESGRMALLVVVFSVASLAMTGCSATGSGAETAQVAPVGPQAAMYWGDSSVPEPIKAGSVAPATHTPQDAMSWGDDF